MKQSTDFKVFDEIRKIRSLLERPEIEVSSVHILDEVKSLIQLLDNQDQNDVTFVETGRKIVNGIKSLRKLLKNPNIEVTTSHLLFEIKGFTDI